jgi:hypothetical protein
LIKRKGKKEAEKGKEEEKKKEKEEKKEEKENKMLFYSHFYRSKLNVNPFLSFSHYIPFIH